MPAFRGLKDMFSQMSKDIRYKTDGLTEAVTEVFVEEGEKQAEDMQWYIHTRGARTSPEDGRVRTWDMIKSVESKANVGKTVVTVRTGYIGDKPEQDYYYYQDAGFMHIWAGWVEGTHAIYDSFRHARERIHERLGNLGLRSKAW